MALESSSPTPPPVLLGHCQRLFNQRTPVGEPAWLAEMRRGGLEHLMNAGFPTTRWEAWRNTNLAAWLKHEYAIAPLESPIVPSPWRDLSGHYLQLRNGWVVERGGATGIVDGLANSLALPSRGLQPMTGETGVVIQHTLGQIALPTLSPFVALNTALWTDGGLIIVPRHAQLPRPVVIECLTTRGNLSRLSVPRLTVIVEDNADAMLVEIYGSDTNHVGSDSAPSMLTAPVTEIVLGANAKLEHVRITVPQTTEAHVGATAVRLNRDSRYLSHVIDAGGPLVRHDLRVTLAGEGATAQLYGLTQTANTQHADNHTILEHLKPNTTSDELYKGILADQSSTVFTGRIHVHPHAIKTNAYQNNRHLVLSPSATVNSMPQLEIYADDVKCTHGAAVGSLEGEHLFYLRSRGLNESAARSLLIHAFASELVSRISNSAVQTIVRGLVSS